MSTRREFLFQGLGAVGMGLVGPSTLAALAGRAGGYPPGLPEAIARTDPFLQLPDAPPSVMVGGLPFAPWFTGDDFDNNAIPFHGPEDVFPGGEPPAPTENINVAIIGGGLSGLCTAYLLRDQRPVVFDLRPRFGGNAMGETWRGIDYSLGSAYCISPDRGSFLDHLYRRLGLRADHRLDEGENPAELNGQILPDFYSGSWIPADQRAGFDAYRQVVAYYANEAYPDIPLPEGEDNQWILDLDRMFLKDDILERMGMPIPPLLHAGIQSYCYSSFGAGYEELSAAGGWNFLAAEEYGRWVFPGGNGAMARAMWEPIAQLDHCNGPGGGPELLRAGCRVVDVRVRAQGSHRVQVTYKDRDGKFRSLLAKRAVMACSKHLCKYILNDIAVLDNAKYEAMQYVQPVAYFVANVLLNTRLDRDFYDLFLLADGNIPTDSFQASLNSRVADVINAQFALRGRPRRQRSVLTLYWPLPWGSSRFTFFEGPVFEDYSQRLVPQVDAILNLFGLPRSAVQQVRMTRWGHAFPQSTLNFIADGHAANLIRPYLDVVHFVNQDNWALPAVENSLLDAQRVAEQLRREL